MKNDLTLTDAGIIVTILYAMYYLTGCVPRLESKGVFAGISNQKGDRQ